MAATLLDYLVVAFVSCNFQSVLLCKRPDFCQGFLLVSNGQVVEDSRFARTKWHLQAPQVQRDFHRLRGYCTIVVNAAIARSCAFARPSDGQRSLGKVRLGTV
jgi:hypothetical protein